MFCLMFSPCPRLFPILHPSVGDPAAKGTAGWHTSTSSPGGNSVGRQEIPCLLVRMMFKHVGISVGTLCQHALQCVSTPIICTIEKHYLLSGSLHHRDEQAYVQVTAFHELPKVCTCSLLGCLCLNTRCMSLSFHPSPLGQSFLGDFSAVTSVPDLN